MVVSWTSRGIGRRGLLWTNWWFWEGHHQNFCFVRTRTSRTFISRGRRALRIGLPAFDLSKRSGKEEANHWLTEVVPGRRTFNLQKGIVPNAWIWDFECESLERITIIHDLGAIGTEGQLRVTLNLYVTLTSVMAILQSATLLWQSSPDSGRPTSLFWVPKAKNKVPF